MQEFPSLSGSSRPTLYPALCGLPGRETNYGLGSKTIFSIGRKQFSYADLTDSLHPLANKRRFILAPRWNGGDPDYPVKICTGPEVESLSAGAWKNLQVFHGFRLTLWIGGRKKTPRVLKPFASFPPPSEDESTHHAGPEAQECGVENVMV